MTRFLTAEPVSTSARNALTARFLKCSGREPVRKWLDSLRNSDKREISTAIKAVATGWPRPDGKSLYRPLGDGLYEVKAKSKDHELRVIFVVERNTMQLVHGFIKKSEKTPRNEIATARQRLKQRDRS